MFEGYKIYGPYGSKRKMVALVSPEHRTTMSYARYLMTLHLGRELTDEEEVDHINDNRLDDRIENLQILTPQQNMEKQNRLRRERSLITLTCPQCGEEFTRFRRYTKMRDGGSGEPSCCSRRCSIQYHRTGRKRAGSPNGMAPGP